MPKAKSNVSRKPEIFRTVVLAKNVGRTVASTKKMIQWGLFFGGAEHVVMLKHSVVSGKKVIFFDKAIIFESKTFSASLSHDFRIGSLQAHMDVTQDSEGFLYNLIVEGVNYGELPHMDRRAVADALEAKKKVEAKKAKVEEEEEEEEEEEPEAEVEAEEEEGDAPKKKKIVKKTAPKKKVPPKKAGTTGKKAPVKKSAPEPVNVFEMDEGEDINAFSGEQSLDDMMANLTMKIDPEMIAKYQEHQQLEQKKEENFDSYGGLVDLGAGFTKKASEAPKAKIIGASATETRKNLAKPTAALQGTSYGMGKTGGIGFGGAQTDEFGNPLNPMMAQSTTSVDMAFGMGGQQMGMGGMNNMYGQQGMGGMGGMGMNNMYGQQGMGGMNNMYGNNNMNGGFGF